MRRARLRRVGLWGSGLRGRASACSRRLEGRESLRRLHLSQQRLELASGCAPLRIGCRLDEHLADVSRLRIELERGIRNGIGIGRRWLWLRLWRRGLRLGRRLGWNRLRERRRGHSNAGGASVLRQSRQRVEHIRAAAAADESLRHAQIGRGHYQRQGAFGADGVHERRRPERPSQPSRWPKDPISKHAA